jgi:hypothetical protein
MAKSQKVSQAELSLTSIHGNITFSKSDVWAWVIVPNQQYEFLGNKEKLIQALELDSALSNLVVSDEKNIECHLIVSSRQFDAIDWIRNLDAVGTSHRAHPYNKEYLYNMYAHVENKVFREKIVLLGINIGKRNTYSATRAITPTAFDKVVDLVAASPVSDYISDKELTYWQEKAYPITTALEKSRIKADAANANDLAYIVRKNFYPSMPSPTQKDLAIGDHNSWGEGEVAALVDAQIENNPKYLKIIQDIEGEEYVGYRATLCFSKFPSAMDYPTWNPWVHMSSVLPFPVDFSLRFTLEPARKVRKLVNRKLKDFMDQDVNMRQAGGNSSIEMSEQIALGEELDYVLKKDTRPWVFGRYRMTVEAESVVELKERVQEVIDVYKAQDLVVTWPTGDQFSLLKESLPNDKVRVLSYFQQQELPIISTGVPAGTGTVGDKIVYEGGKKLGWIGPYIGHTVGSTTEPVFLSIHSAIDNNKAPGLAISGGPGGGKTFAALTITYQMVLDGVWTIYIDPKADAKAMKSLPGLENAHVVDLQYGNDGILDPFSIGENISKRLELAIETIILFMGGVDRITNAQNIALNDAVKVVGSYPNPSLSSVVDYLMEGASEDARSLGATLDTIRRLPHAGLCFSRNTGMNLRAEDGLTIITLLGLDLPGGDITPDRYTKGNQLAVAVMFLLTSFTRQLMLNAEKSHPKAIVVDEAWAITSTAQGAKLVNEVARMGRSHNTGLMLISQNAKDFLGESVTNSVSTKMAFRSGVKGEIDGVLDLLGLDKNDSNRDDIRLLTTGQCLMADWSGRVAHIRIDNWAENQNRAFETNPTARKNQ